MTKTIRVLIADDDAELRENLRSSLVLADEANFYVDTVRDADRVVDKVRQWRPHVILLDDRFGNEDKDKIGVRELLPRIRGEFDNVGIVIITAHRGHDVHIIARASAYEADGFLDKPFGRELLIRAVLGAYQAYLNRGGSDD